VSHSNCQPRGPRTELECCVEVQDSRESVREAVAASLLAHCGHHTLYACTPPHTSSRSVGVTRSVRRKDTLRGLDGSGNARRGIVRVQGDAVVVSRRKRVGKVRVVRRLVRQVNVLKHLRGPSSLNHLDTRCNAWC
jgi:hypothetical protein